MPSPPRFVSTIACSLRRSPGARTTPSTRARRADARTSSADGRRGRSRRPPSATISTISTRAASTIFEAFVEPSLDGVAPETRYQFERHGYFVADLRDTRPGAAVFNRAVTLRDSWGQKPGASAGQDRRRLELSRASGLRAPRLLRGHQPLRCCEHARRDTLIPRAHLEKRHEAHRRCSCLPTSP